MFSLLNFENEEQLRMKSMFLVYSYLTSFHFPSSNYKVMTIRSHLRQKFSSSFTLLFENQVRTVRCLTCGMLGSLKSSL